MYLYRAVVNIFRVVVGSVNNICDPLLEVAIGLVGLGDVQFTIGVVTEKRFLPGDSHLWFLADNGDRTWTAVNSWWLDV